MTKYYQHTQIGHSTIIVLTIGLLIIVCLITVVMAFYGFNWIFFIYQIIAGVVLGVYLALHSTLTVVIEEDFLKIRFGPVGVIRKKFPLKDIESCQIVKNPWYYSPGFGWTRHGWHYSVSGPYEVEIEMKTGEKYRIGTDVPNDLEKAIRQSIERTAR